MNTDIQGKSKKEKVFVGMSGGVDSSVAAALLKQQGFDVTGVFIKIWQPEWGVACNWKDERRDAMRVAMQLGIPFETIDLSDEYQHDVAEYLIREYRAGRTPNPDVMCNTRIKFGAFLKWTRSRGADYVATGHYARVKKTKKQQNKKTKNIQYPCLAGRQAISNIQLWRAADDTKDQSYFLWQLKQSHLKHCLFPIGEYKKSEVRAMAKKFGLGVADKKDSQGICFIGDIGMKDFLKKYISEKRGDVLNVEEEVIGYHDGAFFLTIGQRRGFHITDKGANDEPYYIIAKDSKKNTVTVGHEKTRKQENKKTITIGHVSWVGKLPVEGKKYQARFRHLQELQVCKVRKLKDRVYEVMFVKPQTGVAAGQSLVVYDGAVCLGGGVIMN